MSLGHRESHWKQRTASNVATGRSLISQQPSNGVLDIWKMYRLVDELEPTLCMAQGPHAGISRHIACNPVATRWAGSNIPHVPACTEGPCRCNFFHLPFSPHASYSYCHMTCAAATP